MAHSIFQLCQLMSQGFLGNFQIKVNCLLRDFTIIQPYSQKDSKFTVSSSRASNHTKKFVAIRFIDHIILTYMKFALVCLLAFNLFQIHFKFVSQLLQIRFKFPSNSFQIWCRDLFTNSLQISEALQEDTSSKVTLQHF